MQNGWIKLHRELIDKAIWNCSSPEHKTVLITILTMANHQEKKWIWGGEKVEIKPGQFISSLENIKDKCGTGVSIRNVRTALKFFEKLDFMTSEVTNHGRLISITNWGVYQACDSESDKPTDKQTTNDRQASDKQVTTTKECKKERMKEEEEVASLPGTDIFFILRNGNEWELPAETLEMYKNKYSWDFLDLEFGKMQDWLENNKSKRKTPIGMPRFIGSWIARAIDNEKTGWKAWKNEEIEEVEEETQTQRLRREFDELSEEERMILRETNQMYSKFYFILTAEEEKKYVKPVDEVKRQSMLEDLKRLYC